MDQRKLSLDSAATSQEDEEEWWNRRSQLNQAMEDIFHPKSDKFSIEDFDKDKEKESLKAPMYSEDDYQLHRTGSYQPHQPLHRHHHHHKRPSHHSQPNLEDVREEGEAPLLLLPPPTTPTRLPPVGAPPQGDQVKFFLGSATSLDANPTTTGAGAPSGGPRGSVPPPGGGRGVDSKLLRPSLKKSSLPGPPSSSSVQRLPSQPEEGVSLSMDGSNFGEEDQSPPLTDEGGHPREESEPLMSERAGTLSAQQSSLALDAAKSKVTFHLGEKTEKPDQPDDEKDEEGKKHHQCHKERHEHRHHHHHHHHHHKRHPWRQRLGSDVETDNFLSRAVEPEEAEMLPSVDIDDIASRRFEDPKGIRRHKIQAKSSVSSFIHLSRKDGVNGPPPTVAQPFIKKLYDHRPHEIFVELDELLPGDTGEDLEWRETARWIKYEENVEEGSERWGKPHVASLSFHSLLNLRKCLEQGTVLLDLEEKDLPGIAYRVVENMVVTDQILPEHQGALMRALLLRHRHIQERAFPQFHAMRRNNSGYGSLSLISHHDKTKSPKLMPANGSFSVPGEPKENGSGGLSSQQHKGSVDLTAYKALPEIKITLEDTGRRPSQDLEKIFRNSSADDLHERDTGILRRIPEGAEATTVLVGALDFLEQPTIAFVRLAEGVVMPNLMEVSIPVRFLFVLMGPLETDLDYHEVGRSISTLMANTNFHEVAYKAADRRDLLSAINEFLDDSIVLPPGDWERKSLLPIMDIRRKSMEVRNRKKISAQKISTKGTAGGEASVPILGATGAGGAVTGAGAGTPGGGGEETVDGYKPVGIYDPLKRTGCVFGNLIKDVKQRYPWYLSDILDGFNAQCIAAAIFIYFAAISGAITFGGLMGDKTGNLIGVSETLVATSVFGVIFALMSGQPLIIIGATGPLLLYDEILFKFCHDNGIEYLAMRVWIGIWFAGIATTCVALEGSTLVRFFTRFTQEIFAALISLLYIYECAIKVVDVFESNPLMPDYCVLNDSLGKNGSTSFLNNVSSIVFNMSDNASTIIEEPLLSEVSPGEPLLPQPNTALLSFILTVGTFLIAYFLRQFRNSKFLGRSARRALGDFGVPIAIVLMVALGYITRNTYTQKLSVPEGLQPSKPEIRGWIINPMGNQQPLAIWHIFAASLASMLLFILVFLEVQICELIMYKKDRKLKKGSGFHLDLLLMGYLQMGTGLIGGPWMCAATVRSVSHLASLTVMSRTHAPGQAPFVIEVKEQRLTSLLVSLLIGLSVMMAPLLRQVPVACLFGVFLYMGISSMSGIQLFDRLKLLFMPVKHHPDLAYVRKVRTWKLHLYTLVQLGSLCVLWVVKSTEAALAFPFVLLMMVPLRIQLKCFFTPKELQALDGEDADADDAEDEPDFYQQIVP